MAQGWLQVAIFVGVVIALTPPLGAYMARVFTGQRVFLSPVVGAGRAPHLPAAAGRPGRGAGLEGLRAQPGRSSRSSPGSSLYLILRTQGIQPFNPEGFHSGPWDVSFNTTSSFVSNTNWQYYGGETTLSLLLPDGRADGAELRLPRGRHLRRCVALIRGIVARSGGEPRQLLAGPDPQPLLRPAAALDRRRAWSSSPRASCRRSAARSACTRSRAPSQTLALGPAASQVAIKQLGTNGGGFFNVNSAMPFENPNRLTNFVELLSIILIPAALTYTYGRMVGRQREGWAIFAAMLAIYVAFIAVIIPAEQHGTPAQHAAGTPTAADRRLDRRQHGGQGAAQRDRRLGAVGDDHDGHLERLGQLRPRVLHRPRRRRADVGPGDQRGRLRRRRHRPLLDAALRPARRLHRRPDGRPHARVPGQEDPGAGDQAGLARGPGHAAGGAGHRRRWRSATEPGQRSIFARPARRASRRRSTPTSRRPTTTAPPSPATPASSSPTRPATPAPTGSPSPTCSAARR